MKFQVSDTPPPGRAVREEPVDWDAVKAALIKNEGKWVLVAPNVASSLPGQLRAGLNKAFRGESLQHYEFRVSKPEGVSYGKRRTDLWAKYSA